MSETFGSLANDLAPDFGAHVGTESSHPGMPTTGVATAALRQANGQILLHGWFTEVNSVARNWLARLNQDGSLDEAYAPVLDDAVGAWALQSDGKLIIGGSFENVNGVPRSRLARLNPDGSLDTSLANNVFNGSISAVLVQSDQKIVVAGQFFSVNGVFRRGLIRLHPDGAIEDLFGGNVGGTVYSLLQLPDGRLLLGGNDILSVDDFVRPLVARLLSDGRLDTSFAPNFGVQPFSRVFALALQSDGSLLVGGDFFGLSGGPTGALTRLNPDGSFDTTFQPNIGPWRFGFDRENVSVIVPLSDGKILVGGYFARIDDQPRRGIARLNSNGSLDPGFGTVLEGDSISPGADDALPSVGSILPEPGVGVVIAGSFVSVNCLPRNNIARVGANGEFLNGPECGFVEEPPVPEAVRALTVAGWPEPHGLRIQFNVPVDPASATNPANYSVGDMTIIGVVMDGPDAVVLNVGEFDQSIKFISVGGVRAAVGESVVEQTSLLLFALPPEGIFYRLHSNARGNRIAPHYPAPRGRGRFPAGADPFRHGADGSADAVQQGGSGILRYFEFPHADDITEAPPSVGRDHYMVIVHGLLVPPETADYVFFISSDSQSKLFLSPDADSDRAVLIAEERSASPAREWRTGLQKSAPIRLQAEQSYYVEAISATGTGPGNLAVGWSTDPNATAPDAGRPISEFFLRAHATTGPLVIEQNPESIEAANQQVVRFSVQVSGSDASAIGYQWLREGQVIPGATGWTHRMVATPDQNGARFSVRVFNKNGTFNRLTSEEAVLTIVNQTPSPGALDIAFNPGRGPNDLVHTLAATSDGSLVAGGRFTEVDGADRGRIARLLPNGSLDSDFASGVGFDSDVRTVDLDSDGKVLAGGMFANYDGAEGRFLLRLTGDGSRDESFQPSIANTVLSVRSSDPDTVLIGGGFTTVEGVARNRIARLSSNGQIDTSFSPGSGADDWIFAVATHSTESGEQTYVAGDFIHFNQIRRVRLARLLPNGNLDAPFNAGANSRITSIVVQPDGKPVIAGFFNLANMTSRNRIARFNIDGTLDTTFLPLEGPDAAVLDLVLQPDGKLIIGGAFTSYQGVERNRIARLNPDGTLDTTFDPGLGADDEVHAVALLPDGSVAIGGNFLTVNGFPRPRVARLIGTPTVVESPRFVGLPRRSGAGIELAVEANPDQEIVIFATSDLLQPGQPIHTGRGSFLLIDPIDPGEKQRFYRAVKAN